MSERLPPQANERLERLLEQLAADPAAPTTVTAPGEARNVHIADSLSGLVVVELSAAAEIADVGSGAGFPGIVIAIARPDATVHLVESGRRKCEVAERLRAAAGAQNARIVNARAEEWAAGEGAERVDAVTARAVGTLAELAELASPLLRSDGVLVAWKGARQPGEEAALGRASDALAMSLDRVVPVVPFPGSNRRHLYVVRKTGPTPASLPRRPGMAKKRPLR